MEGPGGGLFEQFGTKCGIGWPLRNSFGRATWFFGLASGKCGGILLVAGQIYKIIKSAENANAGISPGDAGWKRSGSANAGIAPGDQLAAEIAKNKMSKNNKKSVLSVCIPRRRLKDFKINRNVVQGQLNIEIKRDRLDQKRFRNANILADLFRLLPG